MAIEKRFSERHEAFFRRMTLPQEEGERFTQWSGRSAGSAVPMSWLSNITGHHDRLSM